LDQTLLDEEELIREAVEKMKENPYYKNLETHCEIVKSGVFHPKMVKLKEICIDHF
jgi:ERCC4-related helicase